MKRRQPNETGELTELERGQIAGLWQVARTDDDARLKLAELLKSLRRRFPEAGAAYYPVRLGAWDAAAHHIEALLASEPGMQPRGVASLLLDLGGRSA